MAVNQEVERPTTTRDAGRPNQWWALAAISLAGLTIGIQSTVINIALPQLSTALHASTGQLQWITSAFILVAGVGMLPAANVGDRYGRKRLMVSALVLFTAASGWCAVSGSAGELIAAQAVLGLAGAALLPLGFAMLPTLFPDSGQRARAVLIWTAASTVGLPLGPIIGGLLLDHFWWGAVFLPNAGLALVGAAAVAALVPEARSSHPVALDVPGAVLSSAALAGVIYGFINAGQHGWGAVGTWAPIVAGVVVLAVFVAWESRSAHPLIELALFRNGHFVWGTAHATIANFAFFGLLFAVPQYLQSVDGDTPLGTGVRLLPMAAGLIVGTQLAGLLAKRFGLGIIIAAGFALAAAGLAVGATTGTGTGYGFAAGWIALLGFGVGIALPTALNAALGALSAERAGAGSGLMQAMRQVGGAIGVAVLGTVLSSGYRDRAQTGHLPAALASVVHDSVAAGIAVARQLHDTDLAQVVRAAFVHGMDLTLIVSAIVVGAGAILAALFLPRRHAPSAAGQPATASPAPSSPPKDASRS